MPALMTVLVATVTFVIAISTRPAHFATPTVPAFGTVFAAGAIAASAIFTTTLGFHFFLRLLLLLRGPCRQGQSKQSDSAA